MFQATNMTVSIQAFATLVLYLHAIIHTLVWGLYIAPLPCSPVIAQLWEKYKRASLLVSNPGPIFAYEFQHVHDFDISTWVLLFSKQLFPRDVPVPMKSCGWLKMQDLCTAVWWHKWKGRGKHSLCPTGSSKEVMGLDRRVPCTRQRRSLVWPHPLQNSAWPRRSNINRQT